MATKRQIDMSEVVIEDDDMELDEALDMLGDDDDDWSGEDGDEVYVELDTTSTGQSASATSSAEFDISSLITDIDDNVEYLTWFLYGKNGTGKTTALSTIDGMLVLAFEDGTLSIKDKVKADGTQKIRIDVWEKLESIYWHLKNGREVKDANGKVIGIEIKVKGGMFLVKSIGFDTLTKMAEICMRSVVNEGGDILNPSLRHHGQVAQRMKYWLEAFGELPVQKVWLAQESSNSEDVDSEEFAIFPALSKSIRTYALSQADVIGRTYIGRTNEGKEQFRLSFAPNTRFVTKDRTNKLGKVIANPKLSVLYRHVFGE